MQADGRVDPRVIYFFSKYAGINAGDGSPSAEYIRTAATVGVARAHPTWSSSEVSAEVQRLSNGLQSRVLGVVLRNGGAIDDNANEYIRSEAARFVQDSGGLSAGAWPGALFAGPVFGHTDYYRSFGAQDWRELFAAGVAGCNAAMARFAIPSADDIRVGVQACGAVMNALSGASSLLPPARIMELQLKTLPAATRWIFGALTEPGEADAAGNPYANLASATATPEALVLSFSDPERPGEVSAVSIGTTDGAISVTSPGSASSTVIGGEVATEVASAEDGSVVIALMRTAEGGEAAISIARDGSAEVLIDGSVVGRVIAGTAFVNDDDGALRAVEPTSAAGHVERTWDVADENRWESGAYIYDIRNRLDTKSVENDDGTRVETDYDQLRRETWTRTESTYDAQDRLDLKQEFRDDGTRYDRDYDAAGTNTWSRIETRTDTAGDPLVQTTYNDDRTRVALTWDRVDAQPWWTREITLDRQQRTDRIVTEDDVGTRTETDWDLTGLLPWTHTVTRQEAVRAGDASRDAEEINTYYRDGSRLSENHDLRDTSTWEEKTIHYNPRGEAEWSNALNDNQTRIITDYDPTNAFG